MSLYDRMSKEVVNIYLEFVSKEDLNIYSVDECFLDVTTYLKMYKKTDYELALEILKRVEEKTGLTATCGIGPNMLLAKVSMDIEAKHHDDCIAKWTYDDVKTKLWNITPLSKMWGIGPRMEKNLNMMGCKTIGDIAKLNPGRLKDKFGVMGYELWRHANGIDDSLVSDFNTEAKDKSFNESQVLFKDYTDKNIKIIIDEIIDNLTARLRKEKKEATNVGLGITYSKNVGGGFYHTTKIDNPTDDAKIISKYCSIIFDKFYTDMPIRKVAITLGGLVDKTSTQLDLFESLDEKKENDEINETIDKIKSKFGKNSILKASSLLEDSTIKERNGKIRGHSA